MALTGTLPGAPAPADLSAFVRPKGEAEEGVELLVRGARCASCLRKIETGVAGLNGVSEARLNLTSGRLSVRWRKGRLSPAAVMQRLDELGYASAAFDPAEARASEDKEGRRLALALGVAGFGVGNVMMFSIPAWSSLWGQEMGIGGRTLMYWLSALIAAPCAVYAGMPFFASAWASLRRGKANMDVPISIGVILTLLISFSETIRRGPHAYFDAAVSLLFLLLIGRYLDHRLRAQARSAARDLLALQAPVAVRLGPDGLEQGVPVREVAVGDLVVVRPGERIPVDGVVESGITDLDLMLVTGETAPERAAPGSLAPAGALNLTGRLVLRARARVEDSTLAEIARLMEAGAQSKSRYVRLADRAAGIYVPVVHTVAASAFVGWLIAGADVRTALLRAVAVLIVTCPCALGLAVPAVQITASGRLFRKGVLVKSGAALERLAEVDCVVFDKTGVLTEGRPRLIEADPEALRLAAPLARASRHVLSRALAAAAGPGPALTDAREVAGEGVVATIGGVQARLGRASFVGAPTDGARETELWFRRGEEPPVRFRFADKLRPDAEETLKALTARGLDVRIFSGDTAEAVRTVASGLGVQTWSAAMLPAEKAHAIDALAAIGRKPLMVGDGLNDAAALAKAHVSMAPGSAADASQNAADLVFTGEGLYAVVTSIDVARAARRRALENFSFSALYNLIAAPAAVFGLVTPLVAALAMSGSSLAVTLNALRMNWAGARGRPRGRP
jgi:P-type Cu2+ transporter